MATIYLFTALAILVIFMGAFNFTTLSTARASMRYKEIGVRKITGAKRKTLISQFLSESLVQAFISLILALALTELMLPLFRISQKYGNILNEKELQLCCLLKSDFSTKEISVVIQQSIRTVYQRKTVIRQKLDMAEKEDIVEFLSCK